MSRTKPKQEFLKFRLNNLALLILASFALVVIVAGIWLSKERKPEIKLITEEIKIVK